MKEYIVYTIPETSPEAQEMLVALLESFDFDGFQQTDESLLATGLQASLDETAIELFFQQRQIGFAKETIPEENWNTQWESDFHPIVIDGFVAVRANFHPTIAQVKHEIIITPKMSFGTGHHATTWMMMKAMEQIDFTQKTVLDFGTGTGILAILAEKLGSAQIIAVDNDEWCINNSLENIEANGCEHINVEFADNIERYQPVDVLLANINRHILLANLQQIAAHIVTNGTLLLSGILTSDTKEMVTACAVLGLEAIGFFERDNWECILLKKVAW